MIEYNDIEFVCIIYPWGTGGNHLCNLLSLEEGFYNRFHTESYLDELIKGYIKKIDVEPDLVYMKNTFKNLSRLGYKNFSTDIENISDSPLSLIYNAHIWEGSPVGEITETKHGTTTDIVFWQGECKIHASIPNDQYETSIFNKKFICQGHTIEKAILNKPGPHKVLKKLWHNLHFQQKIAGIIITDPIITTSRAYKRLKIANRKFVKPSTFNYDIPLKENKVITFNKSNAIKIDSDLFCESNGSYYLQEQLYNNFKISLPDSIHSLHDIWIKIIDKSINIAENK